MFLLLVAVDVIIVIIIIIIIIVVVVTAALCGTSSQPPLPLPSPFVPSAGCCLPEGSQHLEQRGREGEGARGPAEISQFPSCGPIPNKRP